MMSVVPGYVQQRETSPTHEPGHGHIVHPEPGAYWRQLPAEHTSSRLQT